MILSFITLLMAAIVLSFGAYLRVHKDPSILAGYDEQKTKDPARLCQVIGDGLIALGVIGIIAAALGWMSGEGLLVLLVYVVLVIIGSLIITRACRGL